MRNLPIAEPMASDFSQQSTEALREYDQMMVQCVPIIDTFSSIAVSVWGAVLKELERRGDVTIISGSLDRIGDSLIQRHF